MATVPRPARQRKGVIPVCVCVCGCVFVFDTLHGSGATPVTPILGRCCCSLPRAFALGRDRRGFSAAVGLSLSLPWRQTTAAPAPPSPGRCRDPDVVLVPPLPPDGACPLFPFCASSYSAHSSSSAFVAR